MPMQVSVIVPVWNGAAVIAECLNAVFDKPSTHLYEVICVENASTDQSAAIIAGQFSIAKLLTQSVNLGFAGGVNAGIDAASGDVFVLLNQDCIVQEGWIDAFVTAFEADPNLGIAGCTIWNPDGSLNHAGARITKPAALGEHFTDVERAKASAPISVESVTGAVFAITRKAWLQVGRFDEGFYPAYYEESDLCYRAAHEGIGIAYVPQAQAKHLFSSKEFASDPIKHWANQQRARYRFVCKHHNSEDLDAFLQFELASLASEVRFEHAVGRFLGARDTLRVLSDIFTRRAADYEISFQDQLYIQARIGFVRVLRAAIGSCQRIGPDRTTEHFDAVRREQDELRLQIRSARDRLISAHATLQMARRFPGHGALSKVPKSHFLLRILVWIKTRVEEMNIKTTREDIKEDFIFKLGDELDILHAQLQKEQYFVDRRLNMLEILNDYDYR